jgi:molybdopterin/thiamine biosynthesis adenylyltransferase
MLDDDALFAQIAQHDLVLDCTDNVTVRNQLNAGCFAHKTAGLRRGDPHGGANQRLHVRRR